MPMLRRLPMVVLLVAPMCAIAADELKISQLEQDVRDLQRQVRAQSQQIDELRRQLARPADRPMPPPTPTPTPGASTGTWVDASRWRRVQPGMNELDVIRLLGPPTSMRSAGNDRVLLYAMEIGSSGFLGGSVTLRDRVVVEVRKPVLR